MFRVLRPLADCGLVFFFVVVFVCLGNWWTAFQPEKTSLQEFHVNEKTTVMTSLMTHTGQYPYMNDKVNQSQG